MEFLLDFSRRPARGHPLEHMGLDARRPQEPLQLGTLTSSYQ